MEIYSGVSEMVKLEIFKTMRYPAKIECANFAFVDVERSKNYLGQITTPEFLELMINIQKTDFFSRRSRIFKILP